MKLISVAIRCVVIMKSRACLAGVGLMLLMALSRAAEASETTPRPRLAIWCEFPPYARAAEALPSLARHHCDLLLHIEDDSIGDTNLVALCREARRQGVAVHAWFLLPYDEHLYLGEDSIARMRRLAFGFFEWADSNRLDIREAAMDCEPSPLLGQKMSAELSRRSPAGLARVLRNEKNPERFVRSAAEINGLVAALRARGHPVMGTANRVFLDAARYRNLTMEDTLNAPFSVIGWAHPSFIMYRYKASQAMYVAMANRYAAFAARCYGGDAALDLGLVGDHSRIPGFANRAERFGNAAFYRGFLAGMRSPADLEQAVGVALGRGITRINLFSLDGAVASPPGLDAWLDAAAGSRPRGALGRWTPWQSTKLAATMWGAEWVFRGMVHQARYRIAPRPPSPPAEPKPWAASASAGQTVVDEAR